MLGLVARYEAWGYCVMGTKLVGIRSLGFKTHNVILVIYTPLLSVC